MRNVSKATLTIHIKLSERYQSQLPLPHCSSKQHLKFSWQQLIWQQWCRCLGRGWGCRWAHVGWQSGARQSGASGVKRAEKTAGGSGVLRDPGSWIALKIATAPAALIWGKRSLESIPCGHCALKRFTPSLARIKPLKFSWVATNNLQKHNVEGIIRFQLHHLQPLSSYHRILKFEVRKLDDNSGLVFWDKQLSEPYQMIVEREGWPVAVGRQ